MAKHCVFTFLWISSNISGVGSSLLSFWASRATAASSTCTLGEACLERPPVNQWRHEFATPTIIIMTLRGGWFLNKSMTVTDKLLPSQTGTDHIHPPQRLSAVLWWSGCFDSVRLSDCSVRPPAAAGLWPDIPPPSARRTEPADRPYTACSLEMEREKEGWAIVVFKREFGQVLTHPWRTEVRCYELRCAPAGSRIASQN